LPAGNEEATVN